MAFSRSVVNVIAARSSIRTFVSSPLQGMVKEKLMAAITEKISSPFAASCELRWITLEGIDPNIKRKLGTYGFISGARDYIAGIIKKEESLATEHLGYVLERIILVATDMDLGTCWLGGTFNREGFGLAASLSVGDIMPAVTPIGQPAGKRIAERVMRWIVKANNRYPWDHIFFEGKFGVPLTRTKAGIFGDALESIRLAPSAKNGQPWRVIMDTGSGAFHFYNAGGWHLDRGIAACHFDLVIQEQDIKGKWKIEKPNLEAPEGINYVISWFKS